MACECHCFGSALPEIFIQLFILSYLSFYFVIWLFYYISLSLQVFSQVKSKIPWFNKSSNTELKCFIFSQVEITSVLPYNPIFHALHSLQNQFTEFKKTSKLSPGLFQTKWSCILLMHSTHFLSACTKGLNKFNNKWEEFLRKSIFSYIYIHTYDTHITMK